jgi:SAM-dependent methyltransferase
MDSIALYYASLDPMSFFAFGMDRVDDIPEWQPMEYGERILHLGPGKKGKQANSIDCEWPDYDFDAPNCLRFPKNAALDGFDDESVGGIVATHVLEHLADPRILIWECARVLIPGCPLNIVVPKAGSNIFWQDLDHKSGFVLDTWKTLLDSSYYLKGKKQDHMLELGFNAEISIKEGNNVIVTQLIKMADEEQYAAAGDRMATLLEGMSARS